MPLSGDAGNWPIAIEGRPTPPVSQQPTVVGVIASPGFLHTLRIGLVSGRDLADSDISHQTAASPATASIASDTSGRPTAILISQSMAKHFWPNQDPLGARLKCIFLPDTALQVVGVVKDAKIDALDALVPRDVMYLSFRQFQNGFMQLMVRTTSSPLVHVGAITKAVHELDPEQPVVDIRTMDEVAMGSISRRRFTMLLLASFAGLALVLAAVGIYSVLSYAVRQRVREIGIRLALGARPADVLRMTVVNGMRPTLVGVVIGLGGAAALSRLLSSFVFGISGTDPATFAGVVGFVLLVGLSPACCPPTARRWSIPLRRCGTNNNPMVRRCGVRRARCEGARCTDATHPSTFATCTPHPAPRTSHVARRMSHVAPLSSAFESYVATAMLLSGAVGRLTTAISFVPCAAARCGNPPLVRVPARSHWLRRQASSR